MLVRQFVVDFAILSACEMQPVPSKKYEVCASPTFVWKHILRDTANKTIFSAYSYVN